MYTGRFSVLRWSMVMLAIFQTQTPFANASQIEREFNQLIHAFQQTQDSQMAEKALKFIEQQENPESDSDWSIELIQKHLRHRQQVLVRYKAYKEQLYIFYITANSVHVYRNNKPKALLAQIDEYLRFLSSPDGQSQVDTFTRLSQKLFRQLLPFPLLEGHSIVILRERSWPNFPFSTLINHQGRHHNTYRTLPYLIKSHELHYILSLSAYMNNPSQLNPQRPFKLAAFVPDYRLGLGTHIKQGVRATYGPLTYTKPEAQHIARYFDTQLFEDENASELNFRKALNEYGLIHIAGHAKTNGTNQGVGILFGHSARSFAAKDLVSLQVQAEMVVLSICNSDQRPASDPAGLSLAEHFLNHGARSTVGSLWEANDESTAEVITHFYHELNGGFNKSKALQKAKLHYLNQADDLRAHPYYWANMALTGEDSSLQAPTSAQFLHPVLFMASLVLLACGLMGKLNQRAKKNHPLIRRLLTNTLLVGMSVLCGSKVRQ